MTPETNPGLTREGHPITPSDVRTPDMTQLDGSASLAERLHYLKRRRRADPGVLAAWIGMVAVMCWLTVMGIAGLAH